MVHHKNWKYDIILTSSYHICFWPLPVLLHIDVNKIWIWYRGVFLYYDHLEKDFCNDNLNWANRYNYNNYSFRTLHSKVLKIPFKFTKPKNAQKFKLFLIFKVSSFIDNFPTLSKTLIRIEVGWYLYFCNCFATNLLQS